MAKAINLKLGHFSQLCIDKNSEMLKFGKIGNSSFIVAMVTDLRRVGRP